MNTCYHCGKGINGSPVFKRIPKTWVDTKQTNPAHYFPIAAHDSCDKLAESDAAKLLNPQ